MFGKRLTEVTPDDVRSVIERRVQESETIELKGALADREGGRDHWYDEQRQVGKRAKEAIAKELIAFANAEGGTLILGIMEDGDKRADTIAPLPACRALADRLAASVASTSDPRLTAIEYAGVEMEEDGSGIVILRVPQSYRAPHRDTGNRECYVRVGDRSEPMTMRQIQDLTLERSRGLETVANTLDERSRQTSIKVVDEAVHQPGWPQPEICRGCAVRASAFPLEAVFVDRIQEDRRFHLNSGQLTVIYPDGRRQTRSNLEHLRWSPILRGIRVVNAPENRNLRDERLITANGLIEHSFQAAEFIQTNRHPAPKGFPLWWILRTFAQTLITTEVFRVRYGRPDMEFALDFEWWIPEGASILHDRDQGWGEDEVVPHEPQNRIRTYEIPSRDRLPDLFERLHADLGWSCGITIPYVEKLDFETAIESVLR